MAPAFRFHHRLRVRWAEVDPQGIVFNARYLEYADTAVTEYWRALALPYQRIPGMFGGELFVRHAALNFQASARYDDWLMLAVRCVRMGRSSLVLACRIEAGGRPAADVELVYVFADPAAQASRELPQALRDWVQAYEDGASMVDVRVGRWADLQAQAAPLRQAVFIDEQQVPPEMEWDEDDERSLHAVALNRAGDALATARLLPADRGCARIGRMAVQAPLRGCGVGRLVLHRLVAEAQLRGDREIALHAQLTARRFYERSGFVARGPEFDEAGIRHVEMTLALRDDGLTTP